MTAQRKNDSLWRIQGYDQVGMMTNLGKTVLKKSTDLSRDISASGLLAKVYRVLVRVFLSGLGRVLPKLLQNTK